MKILLADDHPLFREGVRHVLNQLSESVEILDAIDYPSLFDLATGHPDLDLALADLNMPGMPGHAGINLFRNRFPSIPLVILTASESRSDAQFAVTSGALGYIQKSSSSQTILNALNRILNGEIYFPPGLANTDSVDSPQSLDVDKPSAPHLTARQKEVLKLLLLGKTNKVIARELKLSEGTIKIHVAGAFRALRVANRVEASIMARLYGFDPTVD